MPLNYELISSCFWMLDFFSHYATELKKFQVLLGWCKGSTDAPNMCDSETLLKSMI